MMLPMHAPQCFPPISFDRDFFPNVDDSAAPFHITRQNSCQHNLLAFLQSVCDSVFHASSSSSSSVSSSSSAGVTNSSSHRLLVHNTSSHNELCLNLVFHSSVKNKPCIIRGVLDAVLSSAPQPHLPSFYPNAFVLVELQSGRLAQSFGQVLVALTVLSGKRLQGMIDFVCVSVSSCFFFFALSSSLLLIFPLSNPSASPSYTMLFTSPAKIQTESAHSRLCADAATMDADHQSRCEEPFVLFFGIRTDSHSFFRSRQYTPDQTFFVIQPLLRCLSSSFSAAADSDSTNDDDDFIPLSLEQIFITQIFHATGSSMGIQVSA